MNGGTASKRMRYSNSQVHHSLGMPSALSDITGRSYSYYQGMGTSNWRPPLPPGGIPSLLFNPIQPPPPLLPPAPAPAPPPPPPESPSTSQSPQTPKSRIVEDEKSPKEGKSKGRKKTMASRYPRKAWNREDAEKALAVENEENPVCTRNLLIKFPDPRITRELVQGFSPAIESVHFQQPVAPRYCFVKLSPEADVQQTIRELSKVKFGEGNISVEVKNEEQKFECPLEEIDPYSLYVGNLPNKVTVAAVKEIFSTAEKVDVGFAQRMKFTRYAFVRYNTVDAAIEAFRKTRNLVFESRSLNVRFYRHRASIGMPGEIRTPMPRKTPAVKTPEATEEDLPEPPPLPATPPTSAPPPSPPPPPPESVDSKENVLEEASRLIQDSTPSESPSLDPEVHVKTESAENFPSKSIKTEPLDQDLDDKLYDKLISAQSEMEQSEGEDFEEEDEDESEDLSEEETNDEEALKYGQNHWDILRKEEEWKESKYQPTKSSAATLSSLSSSLEPIDRLSAIFGNDFGDCDEKIDSENDDLFNELNPDDLDEDEFNVFSP
ncbi:neurofilament heavy polypeptide [Phlebotomus papatasi]|uniref:neurofilament heavy polypeptide n=1 Tax=Phlebotomus papatasi TaxID=29031 RepID=UPI0024834BD3|nr:neurofilament heavy polypeptide [Phlebotomus papatasi]